MTTATKPKTKVPSDFVGLTVAECPKACGAEGCVISGKPYCAHPRKGGLQNSDNSNREALERLRAAQKVLGKKALDTRFT